MTDHRELKRIAKGLRDAPADGRYQSSEADRFHRHFAPVEDRWIRYRVRVGDEVVVDGVVGEIPLEALRGHEATLPAESGRRRRQRLRSAMDIRPIVAFDRRGFPLVPFPDPDLVLETNDGSLHELAVVASGPRVEGPLVIADGHHRTEVAREHHAAVGGDGRAARILGMVVPAGKGLRAASFHRRFALAGRPVGLDRVFDVVPARRPGVPPPGGLLWWPGDGTPGLGLRLRPGTADLPPGHAGVPAAVAARHLLPLAGVEEHDAEYEGDVDAAVADLPAPGAALLLGDVPLASVRTAAETGHHLPPKATRFTPKPLSGPITRPID